jgi:hydroxymethylpyrimidine/phosphomethylpyrimidine kinase
MSPQAQTTRIYCAAITGAIMAGKTPEEAVDIARQVVRESYDQKPWLMHPNMTEPTAPA